MSSALEKSLDEIIGSGSKNNRRQSRRGGKGSIYKPRHGGVSRGFRSHAPPSQESHVRSGEIKITNLHPDLTIDDLNKLMNTIGPVSKSEIKYNTHGKSTGIAFITFKNPNHALIAIDKFDGRLAAGQIITVSTTMSLADRINMPRNGQKSRPKPRQRRERPVKKQPKSIEDLDKELNMYMSGEMEVEPRSEEPSVVQSISTEPTAETSVPVEQGPLPGFNETLNETPL